MFLSVSCCVRVVSVSRLCYGMFWCCVLVMGCSACLLSLFVYMFVCLCVCLFVYVFVCLFVCLFVCVFVGLFVCLFVCLFVYSFTCLFVYMFVHMLNNLICHLSVRSFIRLHVRSFACDVLFQFVFLVLLCLFLFRFVMCCIVLFCFMSSWYSFCLVWFCFMWSCCALFVPLLSEWVYALFVLRCVILFCFVFYVWLVGELCLWGWCMLRSEVQGIRLKAKFPKIQYCLKKIQYCLEPWSGSNGEGPLTRTPGPLWNVGNACFPLVF